MLCTRLRAGGAGRADDAVSVTAPALASPVGLRLHVSNRRPRPRHGCSWSSSPSPVTFHPLPVCLLVSSTVTSVCVLVTSVGSLRSGIAWFFLILNVFRSLRPDSPLLTEGASSITYGRVRARSPGYPGRASPPRTLRAGLPLEQTHLRESTHIRVQHDVVTEQTRPKLSPQTGNRTWLPRAPTQTPPTGQSGTTGSAAGHVCVTW